VTHIPFISRSNCIIFDIQIMSEQFGTCPTNRVSKWIC